MRVGKHAIVSLGHRDHLHRERGRISGDRGSLKNCPRPLSSLPYPTHNSFRISTKARFKVRRQGLKPYLIALNIRLRKCPLSVRMEVRLRKQRETSCPDHLCPDIETPSYMQIIWELDILDIEPCWGSDIN